MVVLIGDNPMQSTIFFQLHGYRWWDQPNCGRLPEVDLLFIR